MQEIWKPIDGYEGLYEVSNHGNVRSLDRYVMDKGNPSLRKGRLISACDNGHGYKYVTLYKDGKQKHKHVHRLVAEAFVDNPNNLNEVNHLDFDKSNNVSTNLEWCSRQYNMHHALINGKLSNEQNYIPIAKINLDGFVIDKFDSIVDAAESVSGVPQNIGHCCRHTVMSMYGYYWEYDTGYSIGEKIDITNRAIVKSEGRCLKPVAKIDTKSGKIVGLYKSRKEAGHENDCYANYIGKCCNGRLDQYQGYKWIDATSKMKIGDIVNT